jgi:hypothetical protein
MHLQSIMPSFCARLPFACQVTSSRNFPNWLMTYGTKTLFFTNIVKSDFCFKLSTEIISHVSEKKATVSKPFALPNDLQTAPIKT